MRASASRARIRVAHAVGDAVRWPIAGVRRATRVQREFAVCMTVGRWSGDICLNSTGGNGEGGGVGLIRECR